MEITFLTFWCEASNMFLQCLQFFRNLLSQLVCRSRGRQSRMGGGGGAMAGSWWVGGALTDAATPPVRRAATTSPVTITRTWTWARPEGRVFHQINFTKTQIKESTKAWIQASSLAWFVCGPCSASPYPGLGLFPDFCLYLDPRNEISSCRTFSSSQLLHCVAVNGSQTAAETEIETWSNGCPGPCPRESDDSGGNARMSARTGVKRNGRKRRSDWRKTVFGWKYTQRAMLLWATYKTD